MGRIAAIGDWAREIGPQRLIFGLAAVGAVYLRFALSLAGYQHSHEPFWVFILPPLAFVCAMVSGWKVMPYTRRAHWGGLVHGFVVLMLMIVLWSLPVDIGGDALARPQAPGDFGIFVFPMVGLVWATQALMRQGPRDRQG